MFPTERSRPDTGPVPPDMGPNKEDNSLHPLEDEAGKIRYNVSTSSNSALPSAHMTLNRALVSYLVPVVVMWFGGAVTEWLQ